MDRRRFIMNMCAAAAGAAFAPSIFAADDKNPYKKNPMRLAVVGTGLMGGSNMRSFTESLGQDIVAVCDVDLKYGAPAQQKYAPKAKKFVDYRDMFAQMDGKIDGVVIATPDNSHYSIAMTALKYKVPMYVEKPLCYSIEQIRSLTQAAQKAGVVTQMGNFVHSRCGIDYVRTLVDLGAIGEVKEVVAWTCRPLTGCNQPPKGWKQWPKPDPIPPTLDWDKWLNITEKSDYYDAIVPLNWRRFFKFGSGSLGDIGCHILDVPITAFELPAPTKVSSRQRGGTAICVPLQDEVVYEFPTSKFNKPLKITWYSGFMRPKNGEWPAGYDKSFLPPLPKEYTDMKRGYGQLSNDGMFIIGTEGVIYSPVMHLLGKPVILPKKREAEFMKKASAMSETFTDIEHHLNFLQGIAGDVKKCNSDFSVAGPLSETIQLGNVTLQTGAPVVWDSQNMRATNNPDAQKYICPPMRPGWF